MYPIDQGKTTLSNGDLSGLRANRHRHPSVQSKISYRNGFSFYKREISNSSYSLKNHPDVKFLI